MKALTATLDANLKLNLVPKRNSKVQKEPRGTREPFLVWGTQTVATQTEPAGTAVAPAVAGPSSSSIPTLPPRKTARLNTSKLSPFPEFTEKGGGESLWCDREPLGAGNEESNRPLRRGNAHFRLSASKSLSILALYSAGWWLKPPPRANKAFEVMQVEPPWLKCLSDSPIISHPWIHGT